MKPVALWNDPHFIAEWNRVIPHRPIPASLGGIEHILGQVQVDLLDSSLKASLATLHSNAREARAYGENREVWQSQGAGGLVGPQPADVGVKLPLKLPRGFVLHDNEPVDPAEISKLLTDRPETVAEAFFMLGAVPDAGSGVHIGSGFVLTAYHVIAHFLRTDIRHDLIFRDPRYQREPFVAGDDTETFSTWDNRWSVAAMPLPGNYHLDHGGSVEPLDPVHGPFRDYGVLYVPSKQDDRAVSSIRASKDLQVGERLTIVGDQTEGQTRVELSRFVEITQNGPLAGTARLDLSNVEPGFSGSPVLDVDGNLVGILFAQAGDEGAHMITTESLVELLDLARASLPIPQLRRVGF